eukprot:5163550-Karenia_brevis.AAC.1
MALPGCPFRRRRWRGSACPIAKSALRMPGSVATCLETLTYTNSIEESMPRGPPASPTADSAR